MSSENETTLTEAQKIAIREMQAFAERHYGEKFDQAGLPHYMRSSVVKYIVAGRPVGDFLRSLLVNDLKGTFSHADDVNVGMVLYYLRFLYNVAPSGCYGDPATFRKWVAQGGLLPVLMEAVRNGHKLVFAP